MTRNIEKRRLGKTGFEVTVLGIGGAQIGNQNGGNSEEVAIQTVLAGLETGINLIDTSDDYIGDGMSEVYVGKALQRWYRTGGRREDLFVSTKTSIHSGDAEPFSYDATMRSLEKSLESLQTDYLDIFHIHDPVSLDPVLAESGAISALRRLKTQGTIRAIGLGCRQHDFHRRCIETGEFDVSITFLDYNLLTTTAAKGVLDTAQRYDVGVLNASIMVGGLLGGEDPQVVVERRKPPSPEIDRARALWLWCRERGVDLGTINLHFCLRQKRIASTLIGFSSPSRVEQNLDAHTARIDEEIWDELARDFPFLDK